MAAALGLLALSGSFPGRSSEARVAVRKRWGIPAVLTDDVILDSTAPSRLKFDCNGAHRNVQLDDITTNAGLEYTIVNGTSAAYNLVVKNAAGTTIGTVNQNEEGIFYCDGSSWLLICIRTIALS